MSRIADRLIAAGMSASEAGSKAILFAKIDRVLGPPTTCYRWFVPGRIEILGKHTDYAGGRSLLCATERGMCVGASPRDDRLVRVIDVARGESVELLLSADLVAPVGWGNYVATVVRRIARNFPSVRGGADIAIASDLPSAAGLSSSSALVVAIFTALVESHRFQETTEFRTLLSCPERLAEYLGCIENGQSYGSIAGDHGVGTFGGSEDHTAILCSRPGFLSCYRFCPVTLECHAPVPAGYTFVIGNSGVRANKTGAARELYNRASRAAAAIMACWHSASGRSDCSLGEVLRKHSNVGDKIRQALATCSEREFCSEELRSRFEQFSLESETIIPAAVAALDAGDILKFGKLVDHSQAAAEQLLGNQTPETISLTRTARRLGAVAASAFGAGFGGSVWALVETDGANQFIDEWRQKHAAYSDRFSNQGGFFLSSAGPALTRL